MNVPINILLEKYLVEESKIDIINELFHLHHVQIYTILLIYNYCIITFFYKQAQVSHFQTILFCFDKSKW